MQQCSLEAIWIGDETPSSSYTIVRALLQILPKNRRPNDVHHNRKGPEGRPMLPIEKAINGKNAPTADEGDEEHGSGHSFPEANRGKGVNGNNCVPRSPLSRPLVCKLRVGSPYSTSYVSKSNKTSLHPASHTVFNPS